MRFFRTIYDIFLYCFYNKHQREKNANLGHFILESSTQTFETVISIGFDILMCEYGFYAALNAPEAVRMALNATVPQLANRFEASSVVIRDRPLSQSND